MCTGYVSDDGCSEVEASGTGASGIGASVWRRYANSLRDGRYRRLRCVRYRCSTMRYLRLLFMMRFCIARLATVDSFVLRLSINTGIDTTTQVHDKFASPDALIAKELTSKMFDAYHAVCQGDEDHVYSIRRKRAPSHAG